MKKINFAYNEPRLGQIEVESLTGDKSESISEEEILRLIENSYPEAIDVEILEETEWL